MPPVIPGRGRGNGRPRGNEELLELLWDHFLRDVQEKIEDVPLIGDFFELITGIEDSNPNDAASYIRNIIRTLVGGYTGTTPDLADADPAMLEAVGTSIQNRLEALEGGGVQYTLTSSTTIDLSGYAPTTRLKVICIGSSYYTDGFPSWAHGHGGYYTGQEIEVQDIIDKWGAPYLSSVLCVIGTMGGGTYFAANSLTEPNDGVVKTLNRNVVISDLGAAACENGGPDGVVGGAGYDSNGGFPVGGAKGSPGRDGANSLLALGSPGGPQGLNGGPGLSANVQGADAPLDGLVKGAGGGGGSGAGGGVNSLGLGQNGGHGIAGGYPGGPPGGGGWPGIGPIATGNYGLHGALTNGVMFVQIGG